MEPGITDPPPADPVNPDPDPSPNPESTPVDNPLRLTACPECGYALDGLPDAGRCPECGQPYDRDELILFGIARGTLADATTAGGWRLVGHLLFLALIAFGNVGVLAVVRPRDPLVRTVLVLLLAQAGFFLFARLSAPTRGTVRVSLDAAGASQVRTLPPDAIASRLFALYAACMPGALLLLCAAALEDAAWRFRLAVAGGAAMLLAVAVHSVGPVRRAAARAIGMPPPGAAADRRSPRAPWPEINDVALDLDQASERYHLRLGRRLPLRLAEEFVNVELALTPEQAEALRARIEAWRAVGTELSATQGPSA